MAALSRTEKAIRAAFRGPDNVSLRRAIRQQLNMGLPLKDLEREWSLTARGKRHLELLQWSVERITHFCGEDA